MLATQQIFLIASLLCFLSFLALLSVSSEGVRGMRELLLASLLGMAGNALYAFGRELPPLLAYEAANVTYAGAGAALVAGYRRLAGQPAGAWPLAAQVALLGVLVALFHYRFDSFAARSAVVSLFQALVCAEIARAVLASRQAWRRPFYIYYFVLAMCALVALGHGGRMLWVALADQAPTSLLQPSAWSVFFLTAVSLALPALATGGLLIAHRQVVVRAEHAANHDYLTGAQSRKAFHEIAVREVARAARTGRPLALLLIDLDHFKAINDRHGHESGDAALKLVADSARQSLRGVDCLARHGGDEFVLLLPDTNLGGAVGVGDKLRHAVRDAIARHPQADELRVLTLSVGVTVFAPGEELRLALARADAAMYDAKTAGRDRVAAHAPEPHVAQAAASPRRAGARAS
ncbi:GGDEF domain-containing protein [Massilia niastensis]|uniref:GGDEF domain-containing protein n=1 Tax=Massilia niastensis TaxID=544911 RepID=UPI00036DD83A|nr:GGDEF domain-containing protein [Massilia niastensis]